MIKLLVYKEIKKEDFDQDWEKYKEWKKEKEVEGRNTFGNGVGHRNVPNFFDRFELLNVTLSDKQFEAIKKEVIKTI